MPIAAKTLRVPVALAIHLLPSLAHADEGVGRPTLDVAAYGSLLSVSSRTFRTDYGAAAHAHLFPWLRVGLRFARGTELVPFEDPGEQNVGFTALGLGFHVHPNVALGFFTFARIPVPQKRRSVDPGASGGHLPQDASFHFLLPGLRVMAIF